MDVINNNGVSLIFVMFLFYSLNELNEVYGVSYPSLQCYDIAYNLNYLNVNFGGYFSGVISSHDDESEDRLYRWKVCYHSSLHQVGNNLIGSNIASGEEALLGVTQYDTQFSRGCGGNSGLNHFDSEFDDFYKDKIFEFGCSALNNSFILDSCEWTGYLNDYDNAIDFECPNNGIIRTVESIHDNHFEDRKWKFECCRVSNSEINNGLVSMNCFEDTHYVNNLNGGFDITKNSYFFNGIDSVHDNGAEDRRFKFRYCKPEDSSNPFDSTNTLATSEYDEEWTVTCNGFNDGHSGIVGIESSHDNKKEDRIYTIKCGNLDTSQYGLSQCGWTGDLNSYDLDLKFNCLENGIIRSIYSRHDNHYEDRIFRLECCNIFTIQFSDVFGEWDSVLSCDGCSRIDHEVTIGVSSEHSETTTDEFRAEVSATVGANYVFKAPTVSGGNGGHGEFSVTYEHAWVTEEILTSTFMESVVVTEIISCEKTYLFQWIQSLAYYISDEASSSEVKVYSQAFLCTDNAYPMCPLGFCANDDCDECLEPFNDY